MFSVKADFQRAERLLSDLGRRQLPFATALALNDTAGDVKGAEEKEIERVFDAPTPYTKRGIYVWRASKSRLTAQVGVKRVQARYLRWQVAGGVRTPRGRALLIPAAIRLNRYGNMPRGAVARLLARGNTFVAGRDQKGTEHLRPGIYQRSKAKRRARVAPKLMVAFAPSARYSRRLAFDRVAQDVARQKFEGHFIRRLKYAIETAK